MSGRLVRRARVVLAGSAQALAPALLGMALSFLVIRAASVTVWGGFVALLVAVQLAAHVVAWGNKDYLLRELSRRPADLARVWSSCLVTRAVLLLPLAPLALLAPLPPALRPLVAVWALLLALYQSFEVLVVYRRAFAAAAAVEGAGFAVTAAVVATCGDRLTVAVLVVTASAATFLRVSLLAVLFRRDIGPSARVDSPRWRLDPVHLGRALPFFLLGLSGMLMSRTDLYCVALLLDPSALGTYQVLTSFLLLLQSVAAFVLVPFVKGLYRLPRAALRSLAARLPLLGVAVLAPALAALSPFLHRFYRLDVAPALLLVGGLSVLPVFAYLPLIYLAYRDNRQTLVLWVNLGGVVVNLGLNLALLPALGLLGALTATAVAQWAMLAAYLVGDRAIRVGSPHAVPSLS